MNPAETPLLAGVGNVERGDRRAGVVGELRAEEGDERAAPQLAERALGAGCSTVAVDVAGGASARVDGVLLVVARAAARLSDVPAGRERSVCCAAGSIGERVEILGGRYAKRSQQDAACARVGGRWGSVPIRGHDSATALLTLGEDVFPALCGDEDRGLQENEGTCDESKQLAASGRITSSAKSRSGHGVIPFLVVQ